MKLELAIVETCGPLGCQVRMLPDRRELFARYSALVLGRVKIRPGQLVAIDQEPAQPEIAWRWYLVPVMETTGSGAILDDRGGRTLDAVLVPGLEMPLNVGDPVFVTGVEGTWEIHDQALDGMPARPERIRQLVLPRIVEILSAIPAA